MAIPRFNFSRMAHKIGGRVWHLACSLRNIENQSEAVAMPEVVLRAFGPPFEPVCHVGAASGGAET